MNSENLQERRIEELKGVALEEAQRIYASIDFLASDPARDRTFGIHVDEGDGVNGNVLGLGRLQCHADGALEVGGFWVAEEARGKGLARSLVMHVLAEAPRSEPVWCIPFAHLSPFYRSFGLRDAPHDEAPDSVRRKLAHCEEQRIAGTYHAVDLLWRPSRIQDGSAPAEDVGVE